MDTQNFEEEIDIHNYSLSNIDIKQELIDEESAEKIQNANEQINGIHSIKQEINDDLNTIKILDNNVDVSNETKRNVCSTHIILNKPVYSKFAHRKRIKSKGC
ncbi:uncharacterized protein LOC130895441 isoform X2 [Diorhabda carinulata]|uniref:uncharacterized protein LOC130895441 isoform X2 n=1 Tax=Diorhabda carinulata TaxID=1163345 RepID=UPI0025A1409C|nr:uncharacterized protein LOC130895441 isoform X2 [Diorhabda carinulata]